ncbi:MAG: N-acetyltransferase [Bifidobacteriaceae bacterium]|jgi:predicted GNAT family acetyltransferase|nr:N-acetyltransferase [Bifidobacteriaceae bacterium]
MDNKITVEHHPDQTKYVLLDGDQQIGELDYVVLKDQVKNFFHTEVNPEYAGQGLGKLLVKQALDDAKNDQIKIQPSCPFVHAFVQKNPGYESLVR